MMKKTKLRTKNLQKTSPKKYPLYFKLLIPLFTLLVLELFARGLSATILNGYLEKKDLRTKLEKIYFPTPEPSNENVLRLYIYGGSTTAGYPVPKVGFVNQLSYQLHHVFGGKSVDVRNLGFSGFTSTMDRYSVISTFWHKPDAMIVYVSHNEFVHPEIDLLSFYRTISYFRDKSALFRLFLATSQRNTNTDTKASSDAPIETKRIPYHLIKPYYWVKLAILKKNYRAIAQIAKSSNIPLIFITAVSNVGQWSPPERPITYFIPSKKNLADLKKVRSLVESNSLDEAEKITKSYLEKNHQDSYFLYMQGQIEGKRGKWDLARNYFEKARDLDLLQWRASTEINNFVRSLEDGKTVRVLDAEEIFKKNSPNGITGYSLILDNVHPNIEGSYLLANSIIDLLRKDKVVQKDWWGETANLLTLDEVLEEIGVTEGDEFQMAFYTALYCITNPFFNFECARDYLDKAEQIKPGDWRIPATRSVIAFLEENMNEAERQYRLASELYGSPIPEREVREIPYISHLKKKLIKCC